MATAKAIRADDGSGLNIATVSFTEGAETRHAQQVTLVDSSTPTQKLAIDSSGNVAVKAAANSGVDIGDVTINNASGASAVNIQDGGNSLTVDGTFWQATQPVSATALPLPTGAATAAKQPALGTAGSASADVISVQGVASMTALKVDASGVAVPVTDNSGSLTVDNAGTFAVQAAQSGTWNVNNVSGTVSLPTGAATAAKQPALGTAGSASSDVISVQGIASGTPLVASVATGPAAAGVTLKSVVISSSSSGNNTLIAAVTSKKITVVAFALSFSGTVNAKFQDGASGTDLTGLFYGIANSGAGSATSAPGFLFQGSTNTLLNLNLSGSVAVGGFVTYYEA